MMPAAEIQTRQSRPQVSIGPSVRHSKRIELGLDSSLATERSPASTVMQAHASARTPMMYRVTLSPLSLPVFSLSAEARRVPTSLSEAKDGPPLILYKIE
jgi:hypothetical protein